MYVYQFIPQNRPSRPVKTVYTNLFAKNRKLHEMQLPIVFFFTLGKKIVILKKIFFRHASSYNVLVHV